MEKIKFKYHPNVWEQGLFSKKEDDFTSTCECCGEETKYFLETMYSVEDVECICPRCVSNGNAAEKFDGIFIQDAETNKVSDNDKIDELFKRTPGYISWQGEYWLACCNDFCAYIGEVGTKELEEMEIANEVFNEYNSRLYKIENVREYLFKAGSISGYLFKCLHCDKYHLWVDAD